LVDVYHRVGPSLGRAAVSERTLRISVVVPATNDPPTLERCLTALHAGDEPLDQLVVVDDSSDTSVSCARNIGVARTTGDVLVFVDADVAVHPDALARIRRLLDQRPELTAVFGSYDDAPTDPSLVSRFRNLLHHHIHHEGAGRAETFWAGIGAVRRTAFEDVGGFDERFERPSIEDVELGMRLVRAGHEILLDPSIQGTHLKRWTLPEMVRSDFRDRGVPWVELLMRSRSPASTLNLGWRHRLSAAAAVAVAAAPLTRSRRLAAGATLALVTLNWRFYRLLFRVGGARQAAVGIPLHLIHHLTGVASVPVGVIRHLRYRRERNPAR
jgi:cellulose synthase/poly-beta-1,6-N-acetylglucosamine synthase-like glycosyltransferase